MPTLHTALCNLLHIEIPIIQAPSRVATPALVAAVSNAGGLGMLGMAGRDPEGIRRMIAEAHQLTGRPFGANFLLRPQEETDTRLAACLEAGVPVVSFFWDDPSPYFDGGWPGAPHHALRNSTITQWEAAGCPPSDQRPGEAGVLGYSAEGSPIERYRSLTPLIGATGSIEAMSLYAGQSVGLVTQSQPAGDIVRAVAEEAIRVLQHCASLVRTEDNVS